MLVYPKYLIEYELEIYDYRLEKIYTNAICEDCPDYKKAFKEEYYRKCDCPHFPIIDDE